MMKSLKINTIMNFIIEYTSHTVSIFVGAGMDKVPYWMTNCYNQKLNGLINNWESIDFFLSPIWDSRQKHAGMTFKLEGI